jgi:GINS complex subunit 4
MVAEMLEQIRNQQDFVDSVFEERAQLTEEKSFVNKLYQMEIDRLRYMVSSYLRTRLRKVPTVFFVLVFNG